MQEGEQAILATYLACCPPIEAYKWLELNWVKPPVAGYGFSERCNLERSRRILDYILVRRRDSLIDLGLAKFGYTLSVLKTIFGRGNIGVRCALLSNPCLFSSSVHLIAAIDLSLVVRRNNKREMESLAKNPYLPNEFYEHLLQRTKYFQDISDKQYKILLKAFGTNIRLSEPYNSLYMDGWHEYSYNKISSLAWELSKTLPATQEWAAILCTLLQKADLPIGFKELESTIKRWEIDPPVKEGEKNPWLGEGYYLRTRLADLMKPNEELLKNSDSAIRRSFYRRFEPWSFKNWPDFAVSDNEIFLEEALRSNMNLWQSEKERAKLSTLAWAHPDPRSDMQMPNLYRYVENRVQKENPGWFKTINEREDLTPSIERIESKIDLLSERFDTLEANEVPTQRWWKKI